MVGIPVKISNPYALMTKGEMMATCRNQSMLDLVAADTVSCGKWKRTNMQCGKCVPCLIRRASFHAAKKVDNTSYALPGTDLQAVIEGSRNKDDLLAMILATTTIKPTDIPSWLTSSGPLPLDRNARNALLDVARRGMDEMHTFLKHNHLV